MAEEEYEFLPYGDISDLKRELEGMKGKKDISVKELHDAVQKLSHTMSDMLEIFISASDQLKLSEKDFESEARKHELMIARLDKIIDQNKTIAEGLVAIVDMVKEKVAVPRTREERPRPRPQEDTFFKPTAQPYPFMQQQEMQMQRPQIPQNQMPPQMPSMPPPPMGQDFGQMPPMEPTPPDLDFPDEPLGLDEPKKKGIFGMFKK